MANQVHTTSLIASLPTIRELPTPEARQPLKGRVLALKYSFAS